MLAVVVMEVVVKDRRNLLDKGDWFLRMERTKMATHSINKSNKNHLLDREIRVIITEIFHCRFHNDFALLNFDFLQFSYVLPLFLRPKKTLQPLINRIIRFFIPLIIDHVSCPYSDI
jgi:hypothetical protein